LSFDTSALLPLTYHHAGKAIDGGDAGAANQPGQSGASSDGASAGAGGEIPAVGAAATLAGGSGAPVSFALARTVVLTMAHQATIVFPMMEMRPTRVAAAAVVCRVARSSGDNI
jgi:hypothetical protein